MKRCVSGNSEAVLAPGLVQTTPRILAEAADPLHPLSAGGWPQPDVCPELTKSHTGSSDEESGLISHPF